MRVAADQFLAAVIGDLAKIADAALLKQQREKIDLEEHVAELIDERRVIARVGGVGQLVGLLDGMRNDCSRGLFAVPGAFDPQLAGQLVEPPK